MIRKCCKCLFGNQDKQKKYETQDQKKKRYRNQIMAELYIAQQQQSNNSFPINNGNFQPNYTSANFNSNNQSYFNPYEVYQERVQVRVQKTHQEIIAQQIARSEEFIDQLRLKGVQVDDYFAYNRLFFQCAACSLPFNQRQKPNLRNCGHMVCNNSKCYRLQCAVPGCKQKSGIKIFGYWPWQDKQTANEDKIQYDFIISYGNMTDNQDVVKRFDGNKTFGQLMTSCPFAKKYLKTIPQNLQALTIKANQIPYQQIKNKKINSMAAKLHLTRSTSLGNSKNVILCINKQLGGNQW